MSSRVLHAASKQVLWASTLFTTLQFELSPSCPTATDDVKHISDGDTFAKASMDPLVGGGEGWTSKALRIFDAAIEKYNVQ